MWKFQLPNRLPAHLCACALLGRVARNVAAVTVDQKEAQCRSHLKDTGMHTHRTLTIVSVTLCFSCECQSMILFNIFLYACFCLTVSELLHALQWCKEVEYSPTIVSAYHKLLTDWGLSDGLSSQVPTTRLLETFYSRWFLMKKSRGEEYSAEYTKSTSTHFMIFSISRELSHLDHMSHLKWYGYLFNGMITKNLKEI